ncbi:MAG: DNA translocase FtsK [Bacteroidales bacterium]|nr:DNA translocase FtsK [Bacteroidales bacterium]
MSSDKKEKPKLSEKIVSIIQFRKDERFSIVMGMIFLSFSLVLALSFFSFFFTWDEDQSVLNYNSFWNFMFSTEVTVTNWGAKIGAVLSKKFIHDWFGIGSFSFIFIFILLGFKLLKINLLPFRWALLHAAAITLIVSISIGFAFGGTWNANLGGYFGTEDSDLNIKEEIEENDDDYIELNVNEELLEVKTNYEEEIDGLVIVTQPKEEELAENIVEKEIISEQLENEDLDFDINQTEEETSDFTNYEAYGDYDPTMELAHYQFPRLDLLEDHQSDNSEVSKSELEANKNKIVETLEHYKISITKIFATIGPTITLYEIVPAPGTRISKIRSLEDDIALSLSALGIRIIAPMPGKGTIGIEVPNLKPKIVSMRSILASKVFQESKFELPVAIGKTIQNETFVFNLAKMPHLLVAGATGQGKSVGLNAILSSLIYKKHPSQLKFVLIDPKKVELTLYQKIENHFLAKLPGEEEAIITDTQKVVNTLNSLCIEMDERYELLKAAKLRNITEYNSRFIKRRLNPEKGHRFMPFIVVVIDEFADLIMTAGKEVELPLARLAQLARAIGIHLIIATQRPTTNIITGVIKANFPARIAFRVQSSMDSRTILDCPGANQLIGKGDMLISQGSELVRVQCAFIDTPEIEKLTDFIGDQQSFGEAFPLPEYSGDDSNDNSSRESFDRYDKSFEDAAKIIVNHQQGSTSLIQRKLSIGYNRAGRIMDQLEDAGIVGAFEGSKARQVLYTDIISLEQFLNTLKDIGKI